MKILFILFAPLFFSTLGVCVEPLIPVEEFYISVETNDYRNRPNGMKGLRVTVSMARSGEDPIGHTNVDIYSLEFPSGKRMFPGEDIRVFIEASEAANKGEVYLKETDIKTFHGTEKTIFRSFQVNDEWVVKVSRAGNEALFSADEGDRLEKALDQAEFGRAWFKLLLTSDKVPKEMPIAKPPKSKGYYLSSQIGEVSGRGISYDVSVARHGSGYSLQHGVSYSTERGKMGTSSGKWVSNLLSEIANALEAIEEGKEYHHASERFSVKANLKTKEADVTWNLGASFKDKAPKKGHFGSKQLNEIRTLIKSYDAKKKWFEEHEHWFYSKDKKQK